MKLLTGQFYGIMRRRREVAGFVLVEKSHLPGERLVPHSHECAYISFVLQGRYTEQCGKTVRECYPGSLAFHPADETHSDHFHRSGGRLFALQLTASSTQRLREADVAVHCVGQVTTRLPIQLLSRLYNEFRASDAASAISIEGLTLELLAALARESADPPPPAKRQWLDEAGEFVRNRFAEPLSLATVAKQVGVHPVHLAREFRKKYRCTVGDYLRRLRIDLARRRLAETDEPITTIALDAGFADHSHLSRTFRNYTGLSPTEFRRRSRQS